MNVANVPCPVCDFPIRPQERIVVSEVIPCPDCGSDLEVAGVEPFSLVEAPHAEEDWGE